MKVATEEVQTLRSTRDRWGVTVLVASLAVGAASFAAWVLSTYQQSERRVHEIASQKIGAAMQSHDLAPDSHSYMRRDIERLKTQLDRLQGNAIVIQLGSEDFACRVKRKR